METFMFSPSWAPVSTRRPRILATRFGDGYEQRSADGIHADLPSWALTFSPVTHADAEAIDAFLVVRGGVTPFIWTPPRALTDPYASTWAQQTSPVLGDFYSVVWMGTQYVAVSSNTAAQAVMTSPDGVNWTVRAAAGTRTWVSVRWNGSLLVAVASGGTGNRVMTSPDGITWTLRASSDDTYLWQDVAWSGTIWAAVSRSGTGNRVMTSPDGITWTPRTTPADNEWYGIAYGAGLFVAVANTGTTRVMTSPDGITWTLRTGPGDSRSVLAVEWNGTRFAAVFRLGSAPNAMYSADGITWTLGTSAADSNIDWRRVAWNGTVFAAVSRTGAPRQVMTSPDGITWTMQTTPSSTAIEYFGIATNGLEFVSSAINGVGFDDQMMKTIGPAGQYLCRTWTRTVTGPQTASVSATFEEVADP